MYIDVSGWEVFIFLCCTMVSGIISGYLMCLENVRREKRNGSKRSTDESKS